jgi:hypothetical protein
MSQRPKRSIRVPSRLGFEEGVPKARGGLGEQEGHDDIEEEVVETKKRSKANSNKKASVKKAVDASYEDEEEDKAPVSSRKAKTKKGSSKANSWISAKSLQEIADAKESFFAMTIPQLKDILRTNQQKVGGTKGELVDRCAEGSVLGAIPQCSVCGGGKLKFDLAKGQYSCPGYMDDDTFVFCHQKFAFDQVERTSWRN